MRNLILGLALAGALAIPAMAEEKGPFGGFKHDRNAPIEITANALEVRQGEQIAIFTGKVVAGQGTLRLTAERVEVKYDENNKTDSQTGAITNLQAKGDVFLSNGAETAQGAWAEYDITTGMVRMGGDVVLTQGGNAGRGESLVINLNTGVARLEGSGTGRVTLSFTAKKPEGGAAPLVCTPEQQAIADKHGLECIPKSSTN